MPEGDTVRRTADRLHQALAGSPLVEADLRWPSLATAQLVGVAATEVVARGKHILQRLDSGVTLHSHLRMEGQWSVAATGALGPRGRAPEDIRAIVGTDTWTAVGRRLGMLDLVATREEHTLVGHLGPDILGTDWDPQRAAANVRASGTTVGAALLDQRNLAGIGTMWAAETLFIELVHPWSPASVTGSAGATDDVDRVLARAHRLMVASLAHGMQAPTGIRREGQNTYVHGRSGRPCRRCGDTVRVAPIGPSDRERTMFYCPTCQHGLAPGDDGRAMRPLRASRGASTTR